MSNERDNVRINYLSRDFSAIKNDLLEYARRYYPDTFRDFSDAGFGALMIDTVSYIGDILSFYLDYQANECFLDTAVEYNNIIKHANAIGYKHQGARATHGLVTLYILVPANTAATGPDTTYIPTLKAGSSFSSTNDASFTLLEDVNFAKATNEIVVANTNASTGEPTTYAIRAYGQVVSGQTDFRDYELGSFVQFRELTIPGNNVTEILSVTDSEGHQYYEVEHLSQNTIFLPISNSDASTNIDAPNIIKPVIVPRRYTVRRDRFATNIRFGYGSDSELRSLSLAEPRDLVMNLHSKDYVTDEAMDPSVLVQGDKFGVGPSDTTIRVIYRSNTAANSTAASNTITTVQASNFVFSDRATLNETTMNTVRGSLEVTNDTSVQGDIRAPGLQELKSLIKGAYSTQNRAVTLSDYKSLALTMPAKFGGIYRCTITQDVDSNLRNINVYVVNRSPSGALIACNNIIKENLKTWLNSKRMINDSVDILNAKIVNLGFSFEILAEKNVDRRKVMDTAIARVSEYVSRALDIGERFNVSNIYKVLNNTVGVLDTLRVSVHQKTGIGYSSTFFNINDYLSPDGRDIYAPKNVIFEVRFPRDDVRGSIKG